MQVLVQPLQSWILVLGLKRLSCLAWNCASGNQNWSLCRRLQDCYTAIAPERPAKPWTRGFEPWPPLRKEGTYQDYSMRDLPAGRISISMGHFVTRLSTMSFWNMALPSHLRWINTSSDRLAVLGTHTALLLRFAFVAGVFSSYQHERFGLEVIRLHLPYD